MDVWEQVLANENFIKVGEEEEIIHELKLLKPMEHKIFQSLKSLPKMRLSSPLNWN